MSLGRSRFRRSGRPSTLNPPSMLMLAAHERHRCHDDLHVLDARHARMRSMRLVEEHECAASVCPIALTRTQRPAEQRCSTGRESWIDADERSAKLRMSRPAVTSSTSASATSDTTRARHEPPSIATASRAHGAALSRARPAVAAPRDPDRRPETDENRCHDRGCRAQTRSRRRSSASSPELRHGRSTDWRHEGRRSPPCANTPVPRRHANIDRTTTLDQASVG